MVPTDLRSAGLTRREHRHPASTEPLAILALVLTAGCSSESAPLPPTGAGAQSTSAATASSGATSTTGGGPASTVSATVGSNTATVSVTSTTGAGTTGDQNTTGIATSTTDAGTITGSTGAGGASSVTTTGAADTTIGTSTTGTSTGGGVPGDVAVYDPADPPSMLDLSGNLGVHDPVVMEQDGTFYMFFTGGRSGINTKTSTDLRNWQGGPTILSPNPDWIAGMVDGVGNLWAPDISYFGGQYHLYYSASTFGENRSCIGHATRPSLSDNSQWQDHGMVICSNVETSGDNWNAIDPNIVLDGAGTPWMSFGSFWGGLKIIQLDLEGNRVDDEVHAIAARPSNGGALEAPFIVHRAGIFYLFLSFDSCCQGTSSTYNIRVARSENGVLGPYVDKDGTPAMEGGGTLLVEGNNSYHGPGHNAVIFVGNDAYNIYHAYPNNGGQLRISELAWDDSGWPVSAGP